jgi:hypothetical protein
MRRTYLSLVTSIVVLLGAGRAEAADTLLPGKSLSPGQSIDSKNGVYRAVFQQDSNFVVYENATQRPHWASNTAGKGGSKLIMQDDGNLVLYTKSNAPLWATGTNEGNPEKNFLKLEDTGELAVYRGTPKAPIGVLWSSKVGRKYKHSSNAAIANAFRPVFRFSKKTRCWPLAFSEGNKTQDQCNSDFDEKFAVFAHVTRPPSGSASDVDGNTFRVSYGVAFGYQEGTYTGASQDIISQFRDAGNHGEDAQYLVVDVVNGKVTSVWADMHKGFYARAGGALAMYDNHTRVVTWVGAYYHPLKLVRETTSVCKSEWEGSYGLTSNIPSGNATGDGLRFLCLGTCGSSRECQPHDTLLNWGDPSGENREVHGKLVVVDEACSAVNSYTSLDGVTYGIAAQSKHSLRTVQAYLGCLAKGTSHPGQWSEGSTFKKRSVYTDAYGLDGCEPGNVGAGNICNATHFADDTKWVTSRAPNNMYLEPTTAGDADVDYAAGAPFNDIHYINGRPRSMTFHTGERVDKVSTTYEDGGVQGHGGDGGSALTMTGLVNDPIVRVELCTAKKNGKVRVGHIKVKTYSGVSKERGNGNRDCKTIAPYGKMLYGFYGRAGGEIDVLGTIWGDLPSSLPAKETSW